MANIIDVIKFVTNEQERSEFVAKFIRVWKPWTPSGKVIPFLIEWESGVINGTRRINGKTYTVVNGMILEVYKDSRGLDTVGAGHLVLPADKLKTGDVISLERAQQLFVTDQKIMVDAIHRKVKVPLLQYEYDAIFSITFNSGPGDALSEIAKEINKGRYDTFPDFIKSYRLGRTKSDGTRELAGRRLSEANIFQNGVYDASH